MTDRVEIDILHQDVTQLHHVGHLAATDFRGRSWRGAWREWETPGGWLVLLLVFSSKLTYSIYQKLTSCKLFPY